MTLATTGQRSNAVQPRLQGTGGLDYRRCWSQRAQAVWFAPLLVCRLPRVYLKIFFRPMPLDQSGPETGP